MAKSKRRIFEHDRRMELKLRIAAKRVNGGSQAQGMLQLGELPEREIVDRLIRRVQRL